MASPTIYSLPACNVSALAKIYKFNYKVVRSKFVEWCLFHRKSPTNKNYVPCTRDEIDITIRKLQANNVNSGKPNPDSLLKVVECDGESVLVHQTKTQGTRRILSIQEAFDLIVEDHLSHSHRSSRDMWEMLSCRFFFPKTWLKTFMRFCECSVKFNEMVHIDILTSEVTDNFDGNFKHVLLYVDKGTDFVIIRPLTSKSKNELTVEILKIFTDFNVPRSIAVYSQYRKLFEEVLVNVENALGTLGIHISTAHRRKTDALATVKVKRQLQHWIDTNKCNNWAIGCHIVQHKMNNIKFKNKSPYGCVFKNPATRNEKKTTTSNRAYVAENSAMTEKKLQNVEIDSLDISDEEDFVLRFDDDEEEYDDVQQNMEIGDIQDDVTEETSNWNSETRTSHLKKQDQMSIDTEWKERLVTELNKDVNAGENVTEQTRGQNDRMKGLDGCCCECGKVVTTSANYCNTCKKVVHLLCSRRVVAVVDSSASVQILCKLCFKLNTDAKEKGTVI